jgi:nicotinate-nucleotide adenylyltransferase
MDKSESKIGILGGCFDPIHIGHLILAEGALQEYGLDRVIFIPNNVPPHKDKVFSSASHRLNMVRLAVMDNPKFEVSDIEIKREGPSYTYDTMQSLKQIYPNSKLYFLIGADAFAELKTWKNWEELIKMVEFIVATRPNSDIVEIEGAKINRLSLPAIDISSSFIREAIKEGRSIRYLVPDRVRDYIYTNKLYL